MTSQVTEGSKFQCKRSCGGIVTKTKFQCFRAISHFSVFLSKTGCPKNFRNFTFLDSSIFCSKPQSHEKPKFYCTKILFESQILNHMTNLSALLNHCDRNFRRECTKKSGFRTKSGRTIVWVYNVVGVSIRKSRNVNLACKRTKSVM